MGQSSNMAHFVAFYVSFQNIVTLKLPFGANRFYWWFKRLYYLLVRVSQIFIKKICSFCPKMTNRIHTPCLGHQKWQLMAFIISIFTRIKDTIENKMIIHFFPIFGDFSIKSYDFAPKYLRNTPWAKVQTWLIL
jgi:hypothetical protein